VRRARQLIGLAIAILACAPSIARAQLCHPGADGDMEDMDHDHMQHMEGMEGMEGMKMPAPPAITARAELEVDAATIPSGGYLGFVPTVSISGWRLEGRISAPVYHLEYRGVKSDGPGDLLFSLSGTIVQAHRARAGVALAVTEDTGNGALGLGMGDAMWMPGVWGSISRGDYGAVASVSYGRMQSLDDGMGGHHHAGSVGSLVNPMNHQELAGAVRGTLRATRALRLHVLASVATPIDIEGTTRAYAATGVHYRIDAWEIGLEAALGLAGDPFHTRFALDLARTF